MASLYNYYVPATPAFSSSPVSFIIIPKLLISSVTSSLILFPCSCSIIPTSHFISATPSLTFSSTFDQVKIWKMGRKYEQETKEENGVSTATFSRFLDSYNQMLWFSYRSSFPTIEDSLFTSDAGWGCMLRSGQTMLAQALINHKIGRDWENQKGDNPPAAVFEIAKLFGDSITPGHPFSIHEIARVGRKYGKAVGEWFAPTTISLALLELVNLHKPEGLKVIVSEDGALYLDKIAETCTHHGGKTKEGSEESETPWHASVILVPLRLGLDNMNSVYYQPILELFQFPQSLGIVGGKPRASLYFVAAQDDNVFFLDPHVVQPAVNTDTDFALDSFHTTCTRKMNVSEMDPSLVLAFYCKDKDDLQDFVTRVSQLTEKHKDATLFTIMSKAPDYHRSSKATTTTTTRGDGGEDDDDKRTRDDDDDDEIELEMDMVVL